MIDETGPMPVPSAAMTEGSDSDEISPLPLLRDAKIPIEEQKISIKGYLPTVKSENCQLSCEFIANCCWRNEHNFVLI